MNKNLAITIFENGANALYQTIDVNDGSCGNQQLYDELKKESIEYFISQIEKQIPKWISVNDKLPLKDKSNDIECLCFDEYHNQVRVLVFNIYHNCWDDESGDDYYTNAIGGKVTHWMPLPNKPILTS